MPRKKNVVLGQQIYQLPGYGPHAKVTIDYDVEKPPPFFQPGAGVVIVGEHSCAPMSGLRIDPAFDAGHPAHRQAAREIPRGGNFEVDENDPAYLAFKQRLAGGRGAEPAPADLSVPVITSQDILNQTPGFEGVDLRQLIAAAPPLPTGTEGE